MHSGPVEWRHMEQFPWTQYYTYTGYKGGKKGKSKSIGHTEKIGEGAATKAWKPVLLNAKLDVTIYIHANSII